MVKFTSTVVAASLLAGTALAAPYSYSDDVEIAARAPNKAEAVVHFVHKHHHGAGQVVDAATSNNDRREYGEHHHMHPHHNHPHMHPHHHMAAQNVDPSAASAPAPAAADPGVSRRALADYYNSLAAREFGEHHHMHPHHNHPHMHPHHHMAAQNVDPSAASAPAPAAADPGVSRRSLAGYYDMLAAREFGEHHHMHPHHNHPHMHPHHHMAAQNVDPSAASAPAPAAADPGVSRRALSGYYASLAAREFGEHHHMHPHHNHPHMHPHHHMAAQNVDPSAASAPAPAPVDGGASRRSLDFDELYARFYDIDELD